MILTLVSPGQLASQTPGSGPLSPRSYLVGIVMLLVLVALFGGIAYVFVVNRLFLYGWLLGGGNLASVIMNQDAPEAFNLPLGLAAGVILLIGMGLLARFVRKYPIRSAEA